MFSRVLIEDSDGYVHRAASQNVGELPAVSPLVTIMVMSQAYSLKIVERHGQVLRGFKVFSELGELRGESQILFQFDTGRSVRGQYEVRTFMSGATLCQGANAKFTSASYTMLVLDLF